MRRNRPKNMRKTRSRKWDDFVSVGEVTAPHGIHGELRVYPTTDFPERLLSRKTVWIDGLIGPQDVVRVTPRPPLVIMQLRTVATREQAELLRGAGLYVPIDSLPTLGNQEYYWFQLEGLEVRDYHNHTRIGVIQQVIRTGGNQDVFEVARDEGAPLLVPALKSVVKRVDLDMGIMEVDVPAGLEDLS
ncbi:MAG: 16S rRNA processing protein RimM [Sulfobacillus thermosulfidooxidans]|nr:MAG: 16S rRNA processing protein RimM [Sulfobacillus thermosulfidooxidans]